ncbi:MAG TPA: LamG domain-containing protein [Polyangiaceae bacterium]|nr:LamG domain-containing protein [Polyangiaceae bacterium]
MAVAAVAAAACIRDFDSLVASDATDAGHAGEAGIADAGCDAPRPTQLPPSRYAQEVLTDNPYAYYRLDDRGDKMVNLTSGGLVGERHDGVAWTPFGALYGENNGAATFPYGNWGYIDFGPNFGFLGDNGAFTIEFWMRADHHGAGDRDRYIFSKETDTDPQARRGLALVLKYNSGPARDTLSFHRFGIDAGATIEYTFPSLQDDYRHIAITNDGSTTKMYVDGALKTVGSLGPPIIPPQLFSLGGSPDNPEAAAFYGALDEFAIYQSALGADRIAAHFAAGASGPCDAGRVCFGASTMGTCQGDAGYTYLGTCQGQYCVAATDGSVSCVEAPTCH